MTIRDASPPMPVLRLALKAEFFNAIKKGEKKDEFRRCTEYWRKRIEGREFSAVWLSLGYPKHNDPDRWIRRPWRGYEIRSIKHPLFGDSAVAVYAIKVNE